ncbi:ankyrin repeat domain-containing protein [Neobacillus notoginsengisoli]|uniref:Ankyrin repeat domain-containing protein n=1 Tax=Neobacillus notoginsengisoli TaxID=1578198 RepID=A0A417Z069_9BACI|nr:ankyrin repeat domain-containing protein [Neobacillus notoginsengisoli]
MVISFFASSKIPKEFSLQHTKYKSYTLKHSLTKNYSKKDYERSNEFVRLYIKENPVKKAIKKLINSGLEVNCPTYFDDENYGDLPLSIASAEGDFEIAQILIKKGAVKHVKGANIPIYRVLDDYEKGALKMVRVLLSNGADTIIAGKVISDYVEATQFFSLYRTENIKTKEDIHENVLIFKELLNAGALVDQQAVVEAAKHNYVELLDYFIEQVGLNVNEGYSFNNITEEIFTPLIAASENNSLETAKYLIEHGADKNIKNNSGRMAIDYAKTDEMRALLSQD